MGSYNAREKQLAPFFDQRTRDRHNAHRPSFCKNCPISNCTLGYVPPEIGTGEELIVSNAPNEDERYGKRPFVGGIGTIFNNLLKLAGYARAPFSLIHTIGCQLPLTSTPPPLIGSLLVVLKQRVLLNIVSNTTLCPL